MPTLKEVRESYPLTQRELAQRAVVKWRSGSLKPLTESAISAIEQGVNHPRPSTKRALARALGVPARSIDWRVVRSAPIAADEEQLLEAAS